MSRLGHGDVFLPTGGTVSDSRSWAFPDRWGVFFMCWATERAEDSNSLLIMSLCFCRDIGLGHPQSHFSQSVLNHEIMFSFLTWYDVSLWTWSVGHNWNIWSTQVLISSILAKPHCVAFKQSLCFEGYLSCPVRKVFLSTLWFWPGHWEVHSPNVIIQKQMLVPEAAHSLTGGKAFPQLSDHSSCHFVKLLLSFTFFLIWFNFCNVKDIILDVWLFLNWLQCHSVYLLEIMHL